MRCLIPLRAYDLGWCLVAAGGSGATISFPREKKNLSPLYLQGIIMATPVDGKVGQGKKNWPAGSFDMLRHLQFDREEDRNSSGTELAWKYFAGFKTHCRLEIGWTTARSKLEWDHLCTTYCPTRKKEPPPDRITGETQTMLLTDLKEYVVSEKVHVKGREAHMSAHSGGSRATSTDCFVHHEPWNSEFVWLQRWCWCVLQGSRLSHSFRIRSNACGPFPDVLAGCPIPPHHQKKKATEADFQAAVDFNMAASSSDMPAPSGRQQQSVQPAAAPMPPPTAGSRKQPLAKPGPAPPTPQTPMKEQAPAPPAPAEKPNKRRKVWDPNVANSQFRKSLSAKLAATASLADTVFGKWEEFTKKATEDEIQRCKVSHFQANSRVVLLQTWRGVSTNV